ncbi:MAG: hypothetical protein DRN96_04405 [Thermoproteota archaeon]|nr:MAG: hypothetical protein DRN96_04405 [Candidatus Korarchaeota archaeon]
MLPIAGISLKIREISSLELARIVEEIREELIGARVGKIYHIDGGLLSIVLRTREHGRKELLIWPGAAVFVTNSKWIKPQSPSSFAMLLRKYLEGGVIEEVRQEDFDRVFTLRIRHRGRFYRLVAFLHSRGDVVLADDEYRVISAVNWSIAGRKLHKGDKLEFKRYNNPLDGLDAGKLAELSDMELWRVLAIELGLGTAYATILAGKLGLNMKLKLGEQQVSYDKLARAIVEYAELLYKAPAKVLYHGENVEGYLLNPSGERKLLNDALDEYYTHVYEQLTGHREGLDKKTRKKLRSLERRAGELRQKAEEYRAQAEAVYSQLHVIDEALKAVRQGKSFPDGLIKIVSIDRRGHRVTMEVDGQAVTLDFLQTASENANTLYEKAKKAERRLRETLDLMKRLREAASEAEKAPVRAVMRRRWFERFRWFISSEGILVAAGKDVKSNRELVKKYMSPENLFFHSEFEGACVIAFCSPGDEVEKTVVEAAEYAASLSKAWEQGLSSAEVYYVQGNQVKATAPHGHYIPKGGFYIEGPRRYVRAQLKLALGIMLTDEGAKLVLGPISAIKSSCKYYVVVRPGGSSKGELARKARDMLLKKVGTSLGEVLELDELASVLPASGELVEEE